MSQTRRAFLSTSALALVAGAIGRPRLGRAGQQPQTPPPVTPVFTELRRGVGFFTGRGGTIGYLINAGGIVVVDAQFPDTAKVCLEGLNQRSSNRGVDLLINTHHHGDHTSGNSAFKGVAKKVVAHQRAAELMREVEAAAARLATTTAAAAAPGTPPPAPRAELLYPDTTFATTWQDTIGGEVVSAKFYGRAHTSGDIAITFERANIVHMGDFMFNRRHPVIDRPAGASIKNWATVLDAAAKDHPSDTIYIFGHAGTNFPVTGDRADLVLMREYLVALLAFVGAEVKAGKTKDEVTAITAPLKGFDQHGPLNRTVLGSAYDELAAPA
jgi:glyoxylase-like metal-dependent hydrolase (beta-lactamase superfamily II)